MIFCARTTRSLRRMGGVVWPSSCSRNAHDKNVLAWANGTLGVPMGGRVRRLRAIEDRPGYP
jgi:hypothetical protein